MLQSCEQRFKVLLVGGADQDRRKIMVEDDEDELKILLLELRKLDLVVGSGSRLGEASKDSLKQGRKKLIQDAGYLGLESKYHLIEQS